MRQVPVEVEEPEWPANVALGHVRALIERGRAMRGTRMPEEARRAWEVAAESTMASAFGRNSTEQLTAGSAISPAVLFDFGSEVDDYPQRLAKQLAIIEEYAKVLEQRAAYARASAPEPAPLPAIENVLHVISRFSRVAKNLRTRRTNRPALAMNDEYDVQYLLHALLLLHFDDVRPEEFGPSVAGQNVRIDFVLAQEKVAIEAKMTRDSLRDKEVGDELLADIGRYQKHPDCKTLVCFIYDPGGLLRNPDGLENDLTRKHETLDVRVVVRPKH